jgi:hypothetical protein
MYSLNSFKRKFQFTIRKKGKYYFIVKPHDNVSFYCRDIVISNNMTKNIEKALKSNDISRRKIQHDDIIIAYKEFDGKTISFSGYSVESIYEVCIQSNIVDFICINGCILKANEVINSRKIKSNERTNGIQCYWDYDNCCKYCNKVWLDSQTKDMRKKCCSEGSNLKNPNLRLPPTLTKYCMFSEKNKLFLKNCHLYNFILAFGSIGCDSTYNSEFVNTKGGCVTVRGRTFCTYRYPNGRNTLLYFVCGNDEGEEIINSLHSRGISGNMERHLEIIGELFAEQCAVNQLAVDIQTVFERLSDSPDEFAVGFVTFADVSSVYDVSIYKNNDDKEPTVHFKLKGNYGMKSNQIKSNHPLAEAMLFPFLFPYGEEGYGQRGYVLENGSTLSYSDYICSLVLQPEAQMYYVNPTTGINIPCNRFQIMSRLMQYFLVDSLSRRIDSRLKHIDKLRKTYFNPALNGLNGSSDRRNNAVPTNDVMMDLEEDETLANDNQTVANGNCHDYTTVREMIEEGEDFYASNNTVGNDDENDSAYGNSNSDGYSNQQKDDDSENVFVPSSVTGSIRHLNQCAQDALHIVDQLNSPHGFLTLTVNTEWPEITEALGEGQTAFDRPDIVCMVFHERLNKLLAKLRRGEYFEANQKVKYEVRVIEYQHRGLPHCHLVFALDNMPDDVEGTKAWIDKHISTEGTEFGADELELKSLVHKFMVHECSEQTPNNPTGCLKKGRCRKRFDLMKECQTCEFDEKGFPIYKRKYTDLNIVSYSKKILLDWQVVVNNNIFYSH